MTTHSHVHTLALIHKLKSAHWFPKTNKKPPKKSDPKPQRKTPPPCKHTHQKSQHKNATQGCPQTHSPQMTPATGEQQATT